MQLIKKSLLVLVASLFALTLFWFGIIFGLHRTFSTPTHIKQAFKDSGIYSSIIGDALDQAQKQQKRDSSDLKQEGNLSLNSPDVRKLIADAFPPAYLQTQSEGILDTTYNWIDGKSAKLAFSIDLTDAKTRLSNSLATYVHTKAATLPPCTQAAMPMTNGGVDIFNATCLPPGFDVNAEAEKARANIAGGDFLKDTTLSADTIKDDKGQTLSQKLQKVPAVYRHVNQGVVGLGVLLVLLGAGVVFLSANWRKGVHKLAVIAIVIGALQSLMGWALGKAMDQAATKATTSDNLSPSMLHTLLSIMRDLVNDVKGWWIGWGLTLLILGIATLVTLRLTKKPEADGKDKVSLPVTDDSIGTKSTEEKAPEDEASKGDEPKPGAPKLKTPPKKSAKK